MTMGSGSFPCRKAKIELILEEQYALGFAISLTISYQVLV
jgi:hypothetical protein